MVNGLSNLSGPNFFLYLITKFNDLYLYLIKFILKYIFFFSSFSLFFYLLAINNNFGAFVERNFSDKPWYHSKLYLLFIIK